MPISSIDIAEVPASAAFIVQVDGKTTILDDDYIVGVKTAPLPDGRPGSITSFPPHFLRR